MSGLLDSSWFAWAVGVAIGFPVLLVVLTEVHHALRRRGSALARPVAMLRTYILPLGALLLLLVKAMQVSGEATSVRLVATFFGVVLLVLALSGLNAALFQGAPEGSWRKRIPSIFLDVARFATIAVGIAVIMAYVWGANVGGLFAALGVTSIVLGLALQNSVGQIISGLLVLFEQPFRLGDWVSVPGAQGRVVEVNWRATHIDTGNGLLIMPNAELAGASFTNYSRPAGAHRLSVTSGFAASDSPEDICDMLVAVASTLPHVRADESPVAVYLGAASYETSIPLQSPADDYATETTFRRWIWYAARRRGLHLDGASDDFGTPERLDGALRQVASTLRLSDGELDGIAGAARLIRYGIGERIQSEGEVPTRMSFIQQGRVQLVADGADGTRVPLRVLDNGDLLGQTALTREPVVASAYALGEVTVLEVDREHVEQLVERKPVLLQEFGRTIEEHRSTLKRVLAASSE